MKRTVPASCQLSKRTGGGNEGRSAIGRPAVRQVRRRGGVPFSRWSAVRAGGRGTVLPVGRLYEPRSR